MLWKICNDEYCHDVQKVYKSRLFGITLTMVQRSNCQNCCRAGCKHFGTDYSRLKFLDLQQSESPLDALIVIGRN